MTPESFLDVANLFTESALLLTASGVVMAVNRAVRQVFGWSVEAGQQHLAELLATPPEQVREYVRLCSRSRHSVLGALTVLRSDGEAIVCRAEGALLQPAGEDTAALVMVRLIPRSAAVGQFLALNQRIEDLSREVARRQQVEKELRDQREQLRVTLSSIGDAVIATDGAGRITFLNPLAQRLTGWTEAEALGRELTAVFRIIHEQTRAVVENPVDRVLREKMVVGLANHTLLVSRDGVERPIDDSAAPIRDERGDVAGVVLVFRDATDKRRAMAALRTSETRFRTALRSAPFVVFQHDRELRYTWIYNQDFRFCPTSLLGHTDADLLSPANAAVLMGIKRRVLETGVGIRQEVVLHLEHESIYYDLTVEPLKDESGTVTGITCAALDITATKRAAQEREELLARERQTREQLERLTEDLRNQQKWLEGVLNLLPVPTLFVEPGTARVIFANRAADELAGGDFPKNAPADKYHIVYHCTDAHGERLADAQMPGVRLARGERLDGFEMDWHTPGGKRSLIVYADTLPAMHGHTALGVLIFQDIGRLKEIEAQLRRANAEKDDFIAMLAHELRNPLVPILNSLHILRQSEFDRTSLHEARTIMERQVQHMARLIDDLLEVSRVTRGKIQLHPERLDLARLLTALAADHRPAAEAVSLTLTLQVPEQPVWMIGDANRLIQIANNLLENAIKFTDPGGRIEISLAGDSRQRKAILCIRDTGIGMEAEMLARLFVPFSQADRSLHRTRGGLGLGLALVKSLTEMHGGRIQASSGGVGQGTEFRLELPLEDAPAVHTAPAETTSPALEHLRILIVEDGKDAADSLKFLLELYGYEVRVAYTGPDGVAAAQQWPPDVVLCDIGLPGLDGFGVARALRRHAATAQVRLIAITGYGSDEDRRKAQESGFDHLMTKPADPEKLQALLVK